MTNEEIRIVLNQKSRELSATVGNLHRYELAVEQGRRQQNNDFYEALN